MRRIVLLLLSVVGLSISAQAQTCDPTLLAHVYNPGRLIVKKGCIQVTGTIADASNGQESDGVRHEQDGDTHGWLEVDPQFSSLLNRGNKNFQGGNLVFEIVCKFRVRQADAKTACQNFRSSIDVPPVGSHVRIVGQYVQDTNHGRWMEIHPVTLIEVIGAAVARPRQTKRATTPAPPPKPTGTAPTGATARCRDGTYSYSQNRRGTCSQHGGVAEWLN